MDVRFDGRTMHPPIKASLPINGVSVVLSAKIKLIFVPCRVSEIKLIRTDTTHDLSQMAESVEERRRKGS